MIRRRVIIFGSLGLTVAALSAALFIQTYRANHNAARYLSLGDKFLFEMEYEQALLQFLQVIRIDPMNTEARMKAADALTALGRDDEALAMYREVLELDDGHIAARERMVDIFLRQSQVDRAIALCYELVALAPHRAANYFEPICWYFIHKNQPDEAKDFIRGITHDAARSELARLFIPEPPAFSVGDTEFQIRLSVSIDGFQVRYCVNNDRDKPAWSDYFSELTLEHTARIRAIDVSAYGVVSDEAVGHYIFMPTPTPTPRPTPTPPPSPTPLQMKTAYVSLGEPLRTQLSEGPDGIRHFIQLSVTVGIDDWQNKLSDSFIARFNQNIHKARSLVIYCVSAKTQADLESEDGLFRLENEILASIKEVFESALPSEILLDDLLIHAPAPSPAPSPSPTPPGPVFYGARHEPSGGLYYGECYTPGGLSGPKTPSGATFYVEYELNEMAEFDYLIRPMTQRHRVVLIAWNMAYEGATLSSVLYDRPKIEAAAHYLQGLGTPILLRFAGEMNIWEGRADAEEFILAYRFVADIMRAIAPNVALVWAPNWVGHKGTTYAQYYPGDEYVDWVGTSMYTSRYFGGTDANEGTRKAYYIGEYANPIKQIEEIARQYGRRKPVVITECGVENYSNTKNEDLTDWAKPHLQTIYQQIPAMFPQVKAIFYFNADINLPCRYTLSRNTELKDFYHSLTAGPMFLSATDPIHGYPKAK